jgi:hypothetical protein
MTTAEKRKKKDWNFKRAAFNGLQVYQKDFPSLSEELHLADYLVKASTFQKAGTRVEVGGWRY